MTDEGANDGRSRAHRRRTEPEQRIMTAVVDLLATKSLNDLNVADITHQSGVSRTTFYFYFASKFAVVAALVKDLRDEVDTLFAPLLQRGDGAPEEAIREYITAWMAVGVRYRGIVVAASEEWPREPELEAIWTGIFENAAKAMATFIDRERARGQAPEGTDSYALATALLWGTERIFYVAATGRAGLPDVDRAIDPLTAMYLGAIHGCTPTGAQSAEKRGQT